MTSRAVAALAHAEPTVFWLADPARPAPEPALVGETAADLVIIGGGYTGLWAALQAKEDDPSRDVLVLEGQRDRLGGLGSQRRILRRQPDARRGQRARPLRR